MNDLSSYGFKPIENVNPAAPKEDLSSYGFKPVESSAQGPSAPTAPQAPVEQPGLLQRAAQSPLTQGVIAAGSSVRSGMTEAAKDVGTFATELVGLFEPKLQEGINKLGSKISNYLDVNDINAGRLRAQQDFPIVSAIGKGVGYTAGMLAPGIKSPKNMYANAGVQSLLGGAMAGEGHRLAGMATGAVLPLLAQSTLGSGAKFLSSNATQEGQIADLKTKLNTSPIDPKTDIYNATNQAFSEFKAIPGEVKTARPVSIIDNTIKSVGNNLTKKQITAIEELKDGISSAKNLEELHMARKAFTTQFDRTFLKGADRIEGKTYTAVTDMKNSVEANLKMNARNLGAIDQYNQANNLFKQSLEADKLNEVLTKANTGIGDLNYISVAKNLQTIQSKNPKAFSPETNKALDGIYKTIREAHTLFGIAAKNAGGITPVINAIGSLANTPLGKAIFVKLGGPLNTPKGRQALKVFTQTLVNEVVNRGAINPNTLLNPGSEVAVPAPQDVSTSDSLPPS